MCDLFCFDTFFLLYLLHLAVLFLVAAWCCPADNKPPHSVLRYLRRPDAKGGKGSSRQPASPGGASRQPARVESAPPGNP
jgi:hypothetical protein